MMLFLFSFLFSFNTYASAPCGGAQVGYWTNPDGSRGGWVASTAKVQAGATIASNAQVCEYAQVKKGAFVLDQAIISGRATIFANGEVSGKAKVMGEAKIGGSPAVTKVSGDVVIEGSPTITGSSNVFARAKVSGGSKIHNAIICQASQIAGFDVIDSDYYCQTEDPEPPHPGELGMKTLLGVDSDRDGVRDDLEIWINDTYSNEPGYNKLLLREEFKAFAKNAVLMMKYKDVKEKVQELERENDKRSSCIRSFVMGREKKMDDKVSSLKKSSKTYQLFESNLMNTHERYKVFMGIQRYFAGWVSEGDDEGDMSKCLKKY